MLDKMRKKAIRFEIDMIENEFPFLRGKIRIKIKKAYFKLLKSFGNNLEFDKPIYLMRS